MSQFDLGTKLGANVVPAASNQEALENCLHYNPGHPFEDCVVIVTTNTTGQLRGPIRLRYSPNIPEQTIGVPLLMRLWFELAPDQYTECMVIDPPPVLENIYVTCASMRADNNAPMPTKTELEDVLNGEILEEGRTIVFQKDGLLYSIKPRLCGNNNIGVFERNTTTILE
jgi:hypothetical protein